MVLQTKMSYRTNLKQVEAEREPPVTCGQGKEEYAAGCNKAHGQSIESFSSGALS